MTHVALALIFCLSLLPEQSPAPERGSLTVFPVPKAWSKYQSPGKICDPDRISLRIDNGDTVQWPQKDRLNISDLALDQAHLVVARCAGKPFQAVRFRFSQFKSTHVCVGYDAYSGIDLWDYTMHGWGCTK